MFEESAMIKRKLIKNYQRTKMADKQTQNQVEVARTPVIREELASEPLMQVKNWLLIAHPHSVALNWSKTGFARCCGSLPGIWYVFKLAKVNSNS